MDVLRRGKLAEEKLTIAVGEFKWCVGLVLWWINTKTLILGCGFGYYPLTLTHLRLLFLADVLSLWFVWSITNQMRNGASTYKKMEKGKTPSKSFERKSKFESRVLCICVISVISVRVECGCVPPDTNPKRVKVNRVSASFPPIRIWTVSMTYHLLQIH